MSNGQAQARSAFEQIDFSQMGTDASVIDVQDLGALCHINIRGDIDNPQFADACQQVLGLSLPREANTFVIENDAQVVWLGPNEWLFVSASHDAATTVEKLRNALQGLFSSVNDVSGGNATLDISGSKARDMLLKGCPIDLHPREFTVGQSAQTLVAKTAVIIWQIDESPVYRLMVRRSFADYLGHWMIDAAGEFR